MSVNAKRSNLDFDEGGTRYIDPDGPTGNRVDNDSWEPWDQVKGDVAWMLFYMAMRYESNPDLTLTRQVQRSKRPLHGKLSLLLQWHEQDPVDDLERNRHERVFQLQGNRNPFINRPELVRQLWP